MSFPFSFWKNNQSGGFFVRSHGQTWFGTGTITVFSSVEEFNGTSWASGTSDSTDKGELQLGDTTFSSKHWAIDGRSGAGAISPNYIASYNRTSWDNSQPVRTTGRVAGGIAAYSGSLLVAKGTTSTNISVGYVSSSASLDAFNGSSWSNGIATFGSATMEASSATTNSLFRVVGGIGITGFGDNEHDTWNGSSASTSTILPSSVPMSVGQIESGGRFLVASYNSGASYAYNGSSWDTLGTTPSYAISNSAATGSGCANGFNSASGLNYVNGGSSSSSASLTSSSVFNGTSWSSGTASSEARAGATGSVLA